MKRREFLLSAGVASTGAAGWYAGRGPRRRLEIRVWYTDAAAAHANLTENVRGYLLPALEPIFESIELSFGGVVALGGEVGGQILGQEWPFRVGRGVVGLAPVDPVRDVNLLVTDGDPTRQPAGYGMAHVAAMTGATHLVRLPSRTEYGDAVPYTTETAVAQLLLHETGHALGLSHADGAVTGDGSAVVASPMIGGYAWAGLPDERVPVASCGCGGTRACAGGDRRLGLRFSACAREVLAGYAGGMVP